MSARALDVIDGNDVSWPRERLGEAIVALARSRDLSLRATSPKESSTSGSSPRRGSQALKRNHSHCRRPKCRSSCARALQLF